MIGKKVIMALEIGRDYIKGLKFYPSLKGPIFKETGSAPIPVEKGKEWKDAASEVLKKVLSGEQPDKIEIIAIIPGHLFFLRNYTFPINNPKKVRQAIPFEMEGDIPLPLEDVAIDSVIIKVGGGTEALVFALPKNILKEYTDPFQEGFRPKVVIPDFVALSFLKTPESRGGVGTLLEIGYKKITLVATHQKGPKKAHSIPLNQERVTDREVEEMASTLKEWRGKGIEIEKIYLCGEGVKEIDKTELASKLGIDIDLLTGDTGERSGFVLNSLIGSGYMNLDINLLRSEEDARKKEVLRRRLMVSGIGLLILLFLGMADLFLKHALIKGQYNSLKSEVRMAFQDILPDVKNIVNEEVQLKTALDKEKENILLLKVGMPKSFDPLLVLDPLLEKVSRDGLFITEVRIEEDVSFQGEAKNQSSIDLFVEEIRKEKGIKDVSIQRIEHRETFIRFHGKILIENGI